MNTFLSMQCKIIFHIGVFCSPALQKVIHPKTCELTCCEQRQTLGDTCWYLHVTAANTADKLMEHNNQGYKLDRTCVWLHTCTVQNTSEEYNI